MTTVTAKEALGKALGKITSGIYVVTAGTGEEKQGMLASWVMQAGFEPPTVTVAIGADREMLKVIEKTGKFVINVLSDSNTHLMGRFAKYKPDQFDGLDYYENNSDGIVLREAVAFLSCQLREKWGGQDHFIVYAEVTEGEVLNADLQPWNHVRKNGFVY